MEQAYISAITVLAGTFALQKVFRELALKFLFNPLPSACDLTMQLNKVRNSLRRTAAEAAFGGYAKIGYDLFRGCKSTLRAGYTVGTMQESQVKFRFGIELQSLQWREIGDILSLAWHRHMYPRNWMFDRGD
jgi:hypothetical protein